MNDANRDLSADILFAAARALFDTGLSVEVRQGGSLARIELVARHRYQGGEYYCGRAITELDLAHARLAGVAMAASEIIDWMRHEFDRAIEKQNSVDPRLTPGLTSGSHGGRGATRLPMV